MIILIEVWLIDLIAFVCQSLSRMNIRFIRFLMILHMNILCCFINFNLVCQMANNRLLTHYRLNNSEILILTKISYL